MGLAGEASAFPGAPAAFDPAAPLANPGAAFEQREHLVRQKLVHVETAKARALSSAPSCAPWSRCGAEASRPQILRERVQQCYRKEGVNHYQNCKEARAFAATHLKVKLLDWCFSSRTTC